MPVYWAPATETCAPALGAVTTGASGAVTSNTIVTGVLEFDDEGLLNDDIWFAVTSRLPFVTMPSNRQAQVPELSTVPEQLSPFGRSAVTVACGCPVPRTHPSDSDPVKPPSTVGAPSTATVISSLRVESSVTTTRSLIVGPFCR